VGPNHIPPNTAHFAYLLNQTHLIQVINSEIGVSDQGEMQCWGASQNMVGKHCFSARVLNSKYSLVHFPVKLTSNHIWTKKCLQDY